MLWWHRETALYPCSSLAPCKKRGFFYVAKIQHFLGLTLVVSGATILKLRNNTQQLLGAKQMAFISKEQAEQFLREYHADNFADENFDDMIAELGDTLDMLTPNVVYAYQVFVDNA